MDGPRPSLGLMRLHEPNRTDMSKPFHLHDQISSEFENEVDESQHGAGQRSSIAPLPTTDTDNFDENSNHLIEVTIIPPFHLHPQPIIHAVLFDL